MKRLITIVLLLCAAAAMAYLFATRHSAPQNRGNSKSGATVLSSPKNSSAENSQSAVPGLVRQLPAGASGIVFADVAALRASPFSKALGALAPTSAEDPQYIQFVEATGFDYSRDLDRVAVALWPDKEPTSVVALAEGRFNQRRITSYALRTGRMIELDGTKVYEVPEQNSPRHVRFAFLAPNRIALADGPELAAVLGRQPTQGLDAAMASRVATVSGAPILAVARTQNLAADLGIDPAHSAALAHMLQTIHNITLSGQPAASTLDVAAAAECSSTLDAFQLSTLLDGFRWMGRAALADPNTQRQIGPDWRALDDLLKAASVSHDGHFVRLKLKITPDMLAAASAPPHATAAK